MRMEDGNDLPSTNNLTSSDLATFPSTSWASQPYHPSSLLFTKRKISDPFL